MHGCWWLAISMLCAAACASGPVKTDDAFAHDDERAAEVRAFAAWQRTVSSTEEADAAVAEFELAEALEDRGLPMAASLYFDRALRAGAPHPHHLAAVARLVGLQQKLDDRFVIPSELNKHFDGDRWAVLSPVVLSRINFMIAVLDYRRGKLEEAGDFAAAVVPESSLHGKALYLQALALADPRRPNEPRRFERALSLLEQVYRLSRSDLEDQPQTRALAALGLGRLSYGLKRDDDAIRWYAAAEQLPEAEQEARLEGASAKARAGDVAGALALLAKVDAVRNPEALVLEAMLHHQTGDGRALATVKRLPPVGSGTDLSAAKATPGELLRLARAGQLPGVRLEGRHGSVVGLIEQTDRELEVVRGIAAWQERFGPELSEVLQRNRGTLVQVADALLFNRADEWVQLGRFTADMGLIVEVEEHERLGDVAAELDSLDKLAQLIRDESPSKGELLFRLAELHRTRALGLGEPQQRRRHRLEAARLLEVTARDYPNYDRRAEVLFSRGAVLEELGDSAAARAAYQRVLADYPGWERAAEVRDRLVGLAAPKR